MPVAAGLATLLVLSTLLFACALTVGGMWGMGDMQHDEMHRQMHGGGSREPQTPVVSSASQVTVEISNFDFIPRDLTVEAGTSVTWLNRDAVPHDAADVDGEWATAMLDLEEAGTLTFDSPDEYEYLCSIHPSMKATLTVT